MEQKQYSSLQSKRLSVNKRKMVKLKLTTLGLILVKLLDVKENEEIMKAPGQNNQFTNVDKNINMTSHFSRAT